MPFSHSFTLVPIVPPYTTQLVVYKIPGKNADTGNHQLATIHFDLKRLTALTSRPNIALNALEFYSA